MEYYVEGSHGLQPAVPAQIVCYDDGDGEWTIDVEDADGRCLRDADGNYPASLWVVAENGLSPMDEPQAIAAACDLRQQIAMPTLPIFIWRDRAAVPVAAAAGQKL